MQAMMLAAGLGRRMGKHTEANTKCMMEVGGKKIVDRIIDAIRHAGINRFVIVTGYEAQKLERYLLSEYKDIEFVFINNNVYNKSNNIYSLYLAREELKKDDTILVESDLVFEMELIKKLVDDSSENLVTVAPYEQWMDGTVTTLGENNQIIEFIEKKDFKFSVAEDYFKTVNIYKFSKDFISEQYLPFLEAYIQAYGDNQYYESVLRIISHVRRSNLVAYVVSDEKWYEIDDPQDLAIANVLFPERDNEFHAYDGRYGGFWRFSKLKDFCYLVNPYFPPEKMINHMNFFQETLIREYPSGLDIQNSLGARMFEIDEDYIVVGNGAAELINSLGRISGGNVATTVPGFNEYNRCFKQCKLSYINLSETGYVLSKDAIINSLENIDFLVIVNPDNPTGSYLTEDEMIEILDVCKDRNVICVVDESFIDFAEPDIKYSLLSNEILERYPTLIVIKSISKSYGVPGIRLGVLATANRKIVNKIKEDLSIWNINSFAEYFLQIANLYSAEYLKACEQISVVRHEFMSKMQTVKYLNVWPSQANYLMCELAEGLSSEELANYLAKKWNILIKDLSDKEGFEEKQFIRIAIRETFENDELIEALNEYGKSVE